jgi:hypothetical protein
MSNKFIIVAVISFYTCLFSAETKQTYTWFCAQGTWKIKGIDTKQCFYHDFDEEPFLPLAPISLLYFNKIAHLKSISFSVKAVVLLDRRSFGISFKSTDRIIDVILEGDVKSIDTIKTFTRTKDITEILSIEKAGTAQSLQADTLWHNVTFLFDKKEIKIYFNETLVGKIHPKINLMQGLSCGIATLDGKVYFREIVIKDGNTTIEPEIDKKTIFHFHMGEKSQNRSGGYFGPIH